MAENGSVLSREFREASLGGYVRTLQQLITRGYDVNACDENARTAVQFAAGAGHLMVVKLLHQNGANLSAVDNNGQTALHDACLGGILKLVVYLAANVSSPRELNLPDSNGNTPLMLACGCGHYHVVKHLIKSHQVDVNATNIRRQTALHLAVEAGHQEVVKFLAKHGSSLDRRDEPSTLSGDTPLMYAARMNNVAMLDLLLTAGADASKLNKYGMTAISMAAELGNVDIVKRLLPHSPCARYASKLRIIGDSPLVSATRTGQVQVIELLLNHEITRDIKRAFYEATRLGHVQVVELFMQRIHHLPFRESEETVLVPKLLQDVFFMAVIHNQLEIVKLFLQRKIVDIDGWSTAGWNALHKAAQEGHREIVLILVEAGVRINVRDQVHDLTPFLIAATQGYEDIMKILLEGNDPHNIVHFEETLCTTSLNGDTALHCAVSQGHIKAATFLLDTSQPPDMVNSRNKLGRTPLHLAVFISNVTLVTLLLQAGGDLTVADNDGDPPFLLAVANSAVDCAWVILDFSNQVGVRNTVRGTPALQIAASMGRGCMCKFLLETISLQRHLEPFLNQDAHPSPDPSNLDLLRCLARNPLDLSTIAVRVIRSRLSNGRKSSLAKQLPLPDKLIARISLAQYREDPPPDPTLDLFL